MPTCKCGARFTKHGRQTMCKSCAKEAHKEYCKQYNLTYDYKPTKQQQQQWYYKRKQSGKDAEYKKSYAEKYKTLVLNHYCNNNPQCICCGQKQREFLTVDHIHGNGAEHRKQIHGNIYVWLVKHNYPEGYQIMCINCNVCKGNVDKPYCRVHHPEIYV